MNNNIHKFPKLPRSLLLISLLLSYEGTLRHLYAAGVGIGFEPTVATCILFTFLVFGPLLAVVHFAYLYKFSMACSQLQCELAAKLGSVWLVCYRAVW